MSRRRAKKKPPAAPKGLSAEAREFWRGLLEEFTIEDVAGLKMVSRSCEALDRMREAQGLIKRHGVIVGDKKGSIKANPAIMIEKEAHRQLLESLKALNLDIEPLLHDGPGRPGGR